MTRTNKHLAEAKKLPKTVFIHRETTSDGGENLYAFAHDVDAVDGDGPTVVGVYVLKGIVLGTKELQMIPLREKS